MIHKIKPKIFSILYVIDSFINQNILFQNKTLCIQELIYEFCFFKLKNKSKLSENEKSGLKKFLLEVNRMNEVYISFKEKNKKMKDKNKKFMSYYLNEIKKEIDQNEIEDHEYSDESSISEIYSIKSLSRNYDKFLSSNNIDNEDSDATIDGLADNNKFEFLNESFKSSVFSLNFQQKEQLKNELIKYSTYIHNLKQDFIISNKCNFNIF